MMGAELATLAKVIRNAFGLVRIGQLKLRSSLCRLAALGFLIIVVGIGGCQTVDINAFVA